MGQRSQIYFRYEGKLILAQYYGWNYGERMISRARYGIEWVKDILDEKFCFMFKSESEMKRLGRIFDTNFDMKDVALSCDIIKEHAEQFPDEPFNDYVFDWQDNNDGQLYVDVKDRKLYYCFRDWTINDDKTVTNTIMSAKDYMAWDSRGCYVEDWEKRLDAEAAAACRDNINAIKAMATLMTQEQLDDFLHGDYEPKPF